MMLMADGGGGVVDGDGGQLTVGQSTVVGTREDEKGATGQGLWGSEGENEIWVGTIERIGSHVSL